MITCMAEGHDEYFYWDYSERSDILNIHRLGKKTAGSEELGDFTIDFDENNNIVGVEVVNASEFFNELNITKNQLQELTTAEIIVRQKGSYSMILLKLTVAQIQHTIPLPTPVIMAAT